MKCCVFACVQDLGLVFVAVYQRALSLLYVDDLLDRVVTKFVGEFDPAVHNYSAFNDTFRQLVLEAEKQSSERSKVRLSRDPTHPGSRKGLPTEEDPLLVLWCCANTACLTPPE
jgi:signal recognition particle receptor subunit alpha